MANIPFYGMSWHGCFSCQVSKHLSCSWTRCLQRPSHPPSPVGAQSAHLGIFPLPAIVVCHEFPAFRAAKDSRPATCFASGRHVRLDSARWFGLGFRPLAGKRPSFRSAHYHGDILMRVPRTRVWVFPPVPPDPVMRASSTCRTSVPRSGAAMSLGRRLRTVFHRFAPVSRVVNPDQSPFTRRFVSVFLRFHRFLKRAEWPLTKVQVDRRLCSLRDRSGHLANWRTGAFIGHKLLADHSLLPATSPPTMSPSVAEWPYKWRTGNYRWWTGPVGWRTRAGGTANRGRAGRTAAPGRFTTASRAPRYLSPSGGRCRLTQAVSRIGTLAQ